MSSAREGVLLDVRELTVRFPTSDGIVQAVSDVSFSLSRGETLGVVGESGSGKSVSNLAIMSLLNRRRTTVSGNVDFMGRDLLTLPQDELRHIRGKDIAMVFQDPFACLHPMYRVGAQIAEAVTAHQDVSKGGPARQIFDQPQHPYTWGLLDSMPSVERRLTALVPIEGSPPSLLAPPSGCPFHPRCRYRFEPCPVDRPPLVAPAPEVHPDACHLSWDEKVREGANRSVNRLGDAA